jgi:glucans biosynthesis protein C
LIAAPDTKQSPAAGADQGRGRLVSLDGLRVAVIVMVIVHHAAQAYGPTGGTWPVTDPANSGWFRPFYTVNAAVGLGLLFLLAGYFVPHSYDRKGSGRFLKERWSRIGLPLFFFTLAIHLPLVYVFMSRPPWATFIRSLYESGWQAIYLHLWFLGHLLLYSAVYVGWRRFADRAGRPQKTFSPPSHGTILAYVVVLALVSWVIRWWFPIDEWVPLFFVLAAEPAHLPQYVSLFVLGVMAYRGDWLGRITTRVGMTWLGLGLTAAASIYAVEAFGWWGNLRATGTILEAFIGTGLTVGLVVLFRDRFHRPRRLLTAMAKASYAAYILHIWVVVGLQMAILNLELPVFLKFALVAALGTLLSFVLGHVSRRVPGMRVMLGGIPEKRKEVGVLHTTDGASGSQPDARRHAEV